MGPLLVLACLLVQPAPAASARRVLAEVKAATGGAKWDRVQTWYERGILRAGELNGSFSTRLEWAPARFLVDEQVSSNSLGTVRSAYAWNGKLVWMADQTGDVIVADSEEARAGAIGQAYVATYAYLFGNRMPARTVLRPRRKADGVEFDVVDVTPRGAGPFELWIGTADHLIHRMVQLSGVARTTTTFSDFRQVDGLTVAFRRTDETEDRRLTSIEINTVSPAGTFEPPPPQLTGVRFPSGADSVTLDFRLVNDQIRLPVSINGKPQEQFLFDIGATNTLDTGKARDLGLNVELAGVSYGGGEGSAPLGYTKASRIEIGGLVMENQVMSATDLALSKDDGTQGIIGYELARRAVVVIDYPASRITFIKPEAFHPPEGALVLPFRFADRAEVLIEANVNGIRGDFQLDTGAGLTLLLNRPFGERHGLIRKAARNVEEEVSGVGGAAKTVVFQPKRFTIGGLRAEVVDARIYLAKTGGGSEEHIAGLIGNGILKQFVMTLDYAHRMVYFEKSNEVAPELVLFRMARNPKSGAIEIVSVAHGSPAARAGIRVGDVVVSLKDEPAEKFAGNGIATVSSARGSKLQVRIRRGSSTRDVVIETPFAR